MKHFAPPKILGLATLVDRQTLSLLFRKKHSAVQKQVPGTYSRQEVISQLQ